MRSKFKKVLAAVSAITVSCTTLMGIPQSAFAADTPDYLALGDSISTGYGLAAPETDGFVYLLADALGYDLTNASADGAMIGDVYTAVTSDDLRTALEDAELITLTIGGNDLMDVLYTCITNLYNEGKATPVTVDTVKTALASGNLFTMMGYLPFAMTALQGNAESNVPALVDTDEFEAALNAYETGLQNTLTYINTNAPDAEVIVNTQYNPYEVFNGATMLTYDLTLINTEINKGAIQLNAVITENAEAYGYTVADVYTAFSGKGASLCNANATAMNLDFHPNAAGHALIADTVYAAVEGSLSCSHTLKNGVCTICGLLSIDETNFPDEIFRNYVNENFDTTDDDMLDADEIAVATEIDVSNMGITDLKGVENFTALTYLSCYYNDLEKLDVSKNTALESLYCYYNQLTSLDVSNNTALEYLDCYSNQLTSLDVSDCTALTYVDCASNQLTSLDVSDCTALTYLNCASNQLTSLDVSNNTALEYLDCYSNQLTSLDVSQNTKLNALYCENNSLTSLDLSNNTELEELYCENNPLWKLDLPENYSGDLYFDAENTIAASGETLDLSAYGLDAANFSGGTLDENGILTPDTIPGIVTYTATLANGDTMTVYVEFGIAVNEENFPDEIFRTYVENFDTNDDDMLDAD